MTAMPWQLGFLLAALMIAFTIAHIFALQNLNMVQADGPGTIDIVVD
jgi:hypothetical protein